jgi:hypothetical protein
VSGCCSRLRTYVRDGTGKLLVGNEFGFGFGFGLVWFGLVWFGLVWLLCWFR